MLRRSAALILLVPCAACGEARPAPGTMEVVRVVRDVLAEPGAWEAVRAHPDGPARVEVICPSASNRVDGVDMPALVVPPPGEVRVPIDEAWIAGPDALWLVARAGVDQLTFARLSEKHPAVRFVFELRAGERLLAREELELLHGQHRTNAWRDLGGKTGVEITGAEPLTLRTEAWLPDGSPLALPFAVRAGFGGLRLVQRLPRARTWSSPRAPNVVLVLMDTLRVDRLSTYGYGHPRPTSPHLSALAERGVLFEACYSTSSWTWPATASILTGLTPMEHGLSGEGSSFLFEHSATLAESLQLAGHSTAAWSANPIVSPRRNFDQGFERFHGAEAGDFRKTAAFFEEVRAFLRAAQGTRFFLYLHLADTHIPHAPLAEGARLFAPDVPADFAARGEDLRRKLSQGQAVLPGGELALDPLVSAEERAWTSQLYDASVWSGDHWLGELVAELAALGLEDRTVLAFTSDHGEELFERGFLGHGQSLRQELVRVPLVLAGPGVPRGKRHGGLVSVRMLAPLLAGLAGVAFDGGEEALRTLAGGAGGEDHVLFASSKGSWKGRNQVRLAGLTDGKWKLELALDGAPWGSAEPRSGGDLALFDLARDPAEREDLSASHPEEAARLRALLEERLRTLEARRVGSDVPAGAATLQMLEHLGYAGDER